MNSSQSTQQLFLFFTALLMLVLGWGVVLFWQQLEPPLRRGIALTFSLGFLVRVVLIALTPMSSHFADTCLIMDSGSVMSHDVRPYDHKHQIALRSQLRTDTYAFFSPMARQPAEWNFHTSSHLPLGMLLYGVFDIWWPHVLGYRLGFSVLDAMLGCFVYWWFWLMLASQQERKSPATLPDYLRRISSVHSIECYTMGLVLLSPILLKGGTVIMESKGAASLLMVASLCFFQSPSPHLRQWVSPALVGLSIAFMGVGVFLLPYFAGWLLLGQSHPGSLSSRWPTSTAWRQFVQFVSIVALCAGVWFIPFFPDILNMVQARLAFSTTNVLFASPWRPVMDLLPDHWLLVKQVFSLGLLGAVLVGIMRERLSLNLIAACFFLYFLTVSVTDGSMDRVYMSLLMTMLLTMAEHQRPTRWLLLTCIVGGLLTLFSATMIWVMKHYFDWGHSLEFSIVDGYTNAVFCLLFLLIVVRTSFGENRTVREQTQHGEPTANNHPDAIREAQQAEHVYQTANNLPR